MKKLILILSLLSLNSCLQYTKQYCNEGNLSDIEGLKDGVYMEASEEVEVEVSFKRQKTGEYFLSTDGEVVGKISSCLITKHKLRLTEFVSLEGDAYPVIPVSLRVNGDEITLNTMTKAGVESSAWGISQDYDNEDDSVREFLEGLSVNIEEISYKKVK